MFACKVVKCKVFGLTKKKQEILEQEWLKYQFWIQTEIDLGIYSSYKTQFNWYRDKRKKVKEKNYPMSLPNNKLKIEKNDNKFSNYWFNFKTKSKHGGIWLPIRPHIEIPDDIKFKESKIVKKDDIFYFLLTIQKEIEFRSYSSAISCDIGEKVLATFVCDNGQRPIFYGTEIRGIRRQFAYIRKKLNEKKLLKKVKVIGHKERNMVNNYIHIIAKEIVDLAVKTNSAIILGDLKNMQKSSENKGKRFKRIINSFAYYKLIKCIEYKAAWQEIQVFKVSEKETSKICSRCGVEGSRSNQGLFICNNCEYRINADFNGAKNILKRFSEKPSINLSEELSSENGAVLQPESINDETLSQERYKHLRCKAYV